MPQDSFRSVVYRSFVTCDDPKGVVECNKTIRRSKTDPQKLKDHIKLQNSTYHEDKNELRNMSSLQMMEVSRGARKLNEVIDSWSNRTSLDNDSKYIAKDLLKGAIDLQQSLVMLGKLQEASSQYIAKSKKKQRNMPVEKTEEYPFGDYDEVIIKPRISADGSSRDCYDELRDVIRDSFARQNLLPKVSPNEGSSSSSQSLKFGSEKQQKGPNLIAKLMGLEEVPSKSMNLISYKKMENEKVLKQRRDLLDIDLPRMSRPRFVVQKVGRERRTLEELIETMQFKGLIERKYEKYHCDEPIVIMKPLHVQRLRAEKLHANRYIDKEKPVESMQMPKKMRGKFPLNALENPSPRGYLKLNKDRVVKNDGESQVRQAKKNLDSMSSTKVNLRPMVKKKEIAVKRIDKVSKIKATKSQESTKTDDVIETTTLKTSKSVRESNVTKTQIPRKKVIATDKQITSESSIKSGLSKKKMKKDKPEAAILVVNKPSDDNLTLKRGNDIQGSVMKTTTSDQITGEVMDASHNPIFDNSENASCSHSEYFGTIIKNDVKYVEDGGFAPCNLDETKGCTSITDTKYILLSNASFLNCVEDLFNIETSCDLITTFPTACEALDNRLILECAREILERKSMHFTKTIFPLQQNSFKTRKYYLSLQHLVEEICDEIDALRSYGKSCGDIVRVDSIYSMLERDLWWKGEVTGAWDSGWTNGFKMEEINVVINDVEKLVLSEILDDFVS